MMKIEFTTNNAAFCNPFDGNEDITAKSIEAKRILETICWGLQHGFTNDVCTDINGNRVGTWYID